MPIHYKISSTPKMMIVEASGKDDDLEEVKAYGMAVIEHAVKLNCSKVLCNEINLEYDLNIVDTFESARLIAENAPSIAKVAIVCNKKFNSEARFWGTVAGKRGLTVGVFAEVIEALDWLEASD